MVLAKSELIALLQKEVRVLLHLISKIDPTMLDYRPTPKQRSTIELLRYLTMMGPGLVRYAKGEVMDATAMAEAMEAPTNAPSPRRWQPLRRTQRCMRSFSPACPTMISVARPWVSMAFRCTGDSSW